MRKIGTQKETKREKKSPEKKVRTEKKNEGEPKGMGMGGGGCDFKISTFSSFARGHL